MSGERQTLGMRLAMRAEGNFWCAYIAAIDTMTDAILVGSIHVNAIQQDPPLREEFMALMRRILITHVKEVTGVEPDVLVEQAAPEHEKAGHS